MINIHRALNNDRLMRSLTGLNRKAFEALLPAFIAASQADRLTQVRKRAPGAGQAQKAKLSNPQQKLFYILFYFKCYPTFDLAGSIFDFDRSQAHRWMHRLQPILEAALGQKMALPERKLESIEQFLKRYPEVKEVMVDGTERPIARPKDPERQTKYYSGKKRRHTSKHLAAVDENKRVLVLSQARYRVHTSPPRLDLRIFRTLPSMDNPILIHAQQVGRIAFGDPRLVKRGPICMTPSLSIKR